MDSSQLSRCHATHKRLDRKVSTNASAPPLIAPYGRAADEAAADNWRCPNFESIGPRSLSPICVLSSAVCMRIREFEFARAFSSPQRNLHKRVQETG